MSRSSAWHRHVILLGLAGIFCWVYSGLLSGDSLFQHEGTMWYGSFHYYVESLLSGHFPYWNPELQSGTFFYPNVPFLGLLDPLVLVVAGLRYIFGLPLLSGYVIFYLSRLLIFGIGAYLLFGHISKNKTGAMLSAGVLVLSVAPQYLRQPGALYAGFLTPLILFFLIRFIEDPAGRMRGIFLSAAALLYGISMNIYIPAYELFNSVIFLAGLWVSGLINFRSVGTALSGRKGLLLSAFCIMVVLMMMAPGLMVYFKDASSDGELFPVQRIALKSGGALKKIMASDIRAEALSDSLSNKQGYFMGYGNLANVLFPDVFKSLPYFASIDALAEMGGYIGLIPLLFAILGFIYSKSRYRFLAVFMLLIIGINMFGLDGVSHKPYNLLQNLFNLAFPPLKMIDMRETFSPFFQLYLCLLASLGFGLFFGPEGLQDPAGKKTRTLLALVGLVAVLKIAVSGYYGGRWLYTSEYDLYLMAGLLVFAICIYAGKKGLLPQALLQLLVVLAVLAELFAFNSYAVEGVLMESRGYQAMVAEGEGAKSEGFQYFRAPFPAPPNVAFGENIIGVKGALSVGLNHSPFSTKRYYDLLTHLPLNNLLPLTGITEPVVRFYPIESVVKLASSEKLLGYLSAASSEEAVKTLYIEEKGPLKAASAATEAIGASENVSWISQQNLYYLNEEFFRRLSEDATLRRNLGEALSARDYSLQVMAFSPNAVTVAVKTARAGYIYYNDGWSRYWRAFDGSREVPVEKANYNFKAVFLEPGEHMVRFVFDPVHYKAGLLSYYMGMSISVLSLLIMFLFLRRTDSDKVKASEGGLRP